MLLSSKFLPFYSSRKGKEKEKSKIQHKKKKKNPNHPQQPQNQLCAPSVSIQKYPPGVYTGRRHDTEKSFFRKSNSAVQ